MVFDLKTQVPGQDVEQRGALDVGRAQHLPQVPLAAGLPLDLLLGENLGSFREMTTEYDHMSPDVADGVGGEVTEQNGQESRAGEQREGHVVLEHLTSSLPQRCRQLGQGLGPVLLAPPGAFELGVVDRYSPLEDHCKHQVVQRLGEIEGMPGLLWVDPQRAVANVPVLAENVRVGVVHIVVGMFPLLGGRPGVPLPDGGVDLRVAHPVPLPVQNVVPDLHVLQDLGGGQHRSARQPRRGQQGGEHDRPSPRLQAPLNGNHPADVAGVALPQTRQDLLAEPVERTTELLDIHSGELCRACHTHPSYRSISMSPAVADTHVWI